jgi:hypothetical protein
MGVRALFTLPHMSKYNPSPHLLYKANISKEIAFIAYGIKRESSVELMILM